MRVLITGASSPLAAHVLQHVPSTEHEFWCSRHRSDPILNNASFRVVDLDLKSDESVNALQLHFDLVIHFAGVTHAVDEQEYWRVNRKGTMRLAEMVRQHGCSRFVYISTRCASTGSGAYGESKLAAEMELQKLDWNSLLIIRPAEVYGAEGREGIDRILRIARRWHVVPALWGHKALRFAPVHINDFAQLTATLIFNQYDVTRIVHICGPEELSGASLAWRIARQHKALPFPLWWPAVSFFLKASHSLGYDLVKPDQITRLLGTKTAATTDLVPLGSSFRFKEFGV